MGYSDTNIFQVIANALGGGLGGYVNARRYQDALKEAQDRTAIEKARLGMESDQRDAALAEHGIMPGRAPTDPTFGSSDSAALLGVGPTQVQRFQQITPTHYLDTTLTPNYAKVTEAQAKRRDATDAEFKTTQLLQQALGGSDMAKAQLAMQNPAGAKVAFPDPNESFSPLLHAGMRPYAFNRGKGTASPMLDDQGNPLPVIPQPPSAILAQDSAPERAAKPYVAPFMAQTKPLENVFNAYTALQGNLKTLAAGGPGAVSAARNIGIDLARLQNPNSARVNVQQLHDIDKTGSLAQRVTNALNLATRGVQDPSIVAAISEAADAVMTEHQRQYQQLKEARKKALARTPGAADAFEGMVGDVFSNFHPRGTGESEQHKAWAAAKAYATANKIPFTDPEPQ